MAWKRRADGRPRRGDAEAVIVGVVSYPTVIVIRKTFQAGVD